MIKQKIEKLDTLMQRVSNAPMFSKIGYAEEASQLSADILRDLHQGLLSLGGKVDYLQAELEHKKHG